MFSPGDAPVGPRGIAAPGPRRLAAALGAADGLFDRVYSSSFNPLYRTGTLAVLFLTIALITGVYLLLVYEIGRPYESVRAIQGDVALGRWIRALHRYASDAAVVAVALHVLRLVVQGKTWGPRALAWVTGVLLTGMMFLSALTGFVLVWDRFGQALAVAGARMLRVLPLFPEPPDRAFVGDAPVPAQFFFMNLFLHVAIPLGMVCFLWLHTARLARAAWFPGRAVALGTTLGLTALAVAWPAPLPPPADLLALPGRVPSDWFYGFWLPVAEASPAVALAAAAVATALLAAVPWLLRPARPALPPPAVSDPDLCEGCEQCLNDCPFDAIEMVAGKHPERHPLRAEVQASRCTSCGLCAASCASLAIGPGGRTARDQLDAARRLLAAETHPAQRTVVVACRGDVARAARRARGGGPPPRRAGVPGGWGGTLHPGTVSYLGGHFDGALVVACPPQNCVHRLGAALTDARLLDDRRPAIPGRIARLPVRLIHGSAADWRRILAALQELRGTALPNRNGRGAVARRGTVAVAFSVLLLTLVATGSRWPQGAEADHAVLRLGWRLAGQARERCRDLTAAELAARPVHMRQPRECVSEPLAYELRATVDGAVVAQTRVRPGGLRGDRPLMVEEDVVVRAGARPVTVTFTPEGDAPGASVLEFAGTVAFERGRVVLITHDGARLVARRR